MKRMNLLPQEERAKASRERGLLWAILILVALVAVLGVVYFKYKSDVGAKQDELAQIESEMQVVQAQIAELSPYAALQYQRESMTETASGIWSSSVPFSIMLQELSLVIPENVRLQTLTATVPPAMLPGTAALEAVPAAAGAVDVTFTGQTERPHRRGRVHDEARPHPAAHGHHAHLVDRSDLDYDHDHGELVSCAHLHHVHRDGAAAALHAAAAHDHS